MSRKIEDESVVLTPDLLVDTLSEGGRGGLVDDTEDFEASDHTSVLGGDTLGDVAVGSDSLGDGARGTSQPSSSYSGGPSTRSFRETKDKKMR